MNASTSDHRLQIDATSQSHKAVRSQGLAGSHGVSTASVPTKTRRTDGVLSKSRAVTGRERWSSQKLILCVTAVLLLGAGWFVLDEVRNRFSEFPRVPVSAPVVLCEGCTYEIKFSVPRRAHYSIYILVEFLPTPERTALLEFFRSESSCARDARCEEKTVRSLHLRPVAASSEMPRISQRGQVFWSYNGIGREIGIVTLDPGSYSANLRFGKTPLSLEKYRSMIVIEIDHLSAQP